MFRSITAALLLATLSCAPATDGVDGSGLHYVSSGAGPAIIFVHGWTCDTTAWAEQLPEFEDDYQAIALDLPGHGQSAAPVDGVYTMDLFADAVEDVRAEVGADAIVLVGHSMGVSVIRQYALKYPERVAGLVVVDGGLPLPVDGEAEPAPIPPADSPWREQMIDSMFVDATTPELRARIREMMLQASDEQALAIAMSMRDPARWSDRTIEAPVLAVMASTREMPDPEAYETVIPKLEMLQLPGTGHFLMMEVPEKFNNLMRKFLQDIGY
jgi:pimeloyl-ACP methyl ester carboxylesterase